jgi:hypothetical protein
VPLILAGTAALLAWLLHILLLRSGIQPPWWLDMPSLAGFYGLLLTAFDQWVWRAPILRRVRLIRTPFLGGTWSGTMATSYDNFASTRNATLVIHQTWQRLSIELITSTSHSYSRSASMTTRPRRNVMVTYSYANEPKPDAPETMHSFQGTATHVYCPEPGPETFNGDYYTGRDRETFGTLAFSRVPPGSATPSSPNQPRQHPDI